MCIQKIIKYTCEDCKQDIKANSPGERWPLMTFTKVVLCQDLLDKKMEKPELYRYCWTDLGLAYTCEDHHIKYKMGRKRVEVDGEGVKDCRCNRCTVRFVEA